MELLINYPKEKYDVMKSDLYNTFPAEMREWGLEAIRNSIPLDKIRAEQKALITKNSTSDYSNGVMNCLNVIDKYRESKDEE